MRGELLEVGIEKTEQLAVEDAERSPHRVALAEDRAVAGHQVGLVEDAGPGLAGDPRRLVL